MVLRLKITLASIATALMAVIVSFVLGAMIPAPLLPALLATLIAGGLAAGFGYMFGGSVAQALADLNNLDPALHQVGRGGGVPLVPL